MTAVLDLHIESELLTRWTENIDGVVTIGVQLRADICDWCRETLPDRVSLEFEPHALWPGDEPLYGSFTDIIIAKLGETVPLCFESDRDKMLFLLRWG